MLRPTVSRPVCLGIKHPSGPYNKIIITVTTVAGLLMWGALCEEKTGLSFTTASGPRQQVPCDPRPYFTVSNSRLPFSSLPRLAGLRWRYSTPSPHGILPVFRDSDLLYDWQFAANQFILAPSPLRLTARFFSPN
jgi:hypothetical protein